MKLPRALSHEGRLADPGDRLTRFRAETRLLGETLGPLLVQLPPSLALDLPVHARFFTTLRRLWPDPVVLEPRHSTWFTPRVEALLRDLQIARVAADPARHPTAGRPGGWRNLAYWRLHGSPRMYYSAYDGPAIASLAAAIEASGASESWCVFDNTASGAAMANALQLRAVRGGAAASPSRGRAS